MDFGQGATDERRRGASLGTAIGAACSALVVGTVWFLPTSSDDRVLTVAVWSAALVVSLAMYRLPWDRWPAAALLAYPGVGVTALTIVALMTNDVSPAYSGFFTVWIYFVALTEAERITLVAIAFALPWWMVAQGSFSATVGVKMPITVGIWLLIGLTLAERRATNAARIKGLVEAASTDAMTGLIRRSELPHVLEAAEKGDVLVIVDLDGFKAINDERGHQAGDAILADFGTAIRSALRGTDVALRYGGDEFLFVLGQTDEHGAESTLERLRDRWKGPGRPTFSAGIAVHGGRRATDTLQSADDAMYRAKAEGKNRWRSETSAGPADDLRDAG
ncbi:MAG TPA: GGDEF domain-containing protein [Candidatus Binatia bacterium]|nr:GGDEF domain-containing protein [Candidatus Binatia bacterium]